MAVRFTYVWILKADRYNFIEMLFFKNACEEKLYDLCED